MRWKTISARKPTAAIGETGSSRMADAAPMPVTPRATVAPPSRLPKAGASSLATPRARSVIEIGQPAGRDMRQRARGEDGEAHDAQNAAKERRREAHSSQCARQGHEVDCPERQHDQVEGVLQRPRRSDLGKP